MFKRYNALKPKSLEILKDENGFALTAILVVFGVMSIIMTLGIVLLPLTQNDTTATNRETATAQSLYLAEAGLNDYVWHLNRIGAEYYQNETHPAQGVDTTTGERWVDSGENGGGYHLEIIENTTTGGFIIRSTGRAATGHLPNIFILATPR
ncbi:MAG: type II secretion system protein [Rubrobacteridae bacterium]|nr:type II secretion system protein [Rubrobacteridae bacterium]